MNCGNFCGFTTGINIKRLTIAVVAVFVYIFASDFVIHQLILGSKYQAIPSLWRTPEEMKNHFIWMFLGQLLIAKYFTFIFAKGYEGKGIAEGFRFGILAGLFTMGGVFIQYAVYPLPCEIFLAWCGLYLVQSVGAGIVAALVYKR